MNSFFSRADVQHWVKSWAFALFFILGAIVILYTKIISDQWLSSILALILVTAYAIALWASNNVYQSDNIYYLGFLYTMTSLSTILFSFHSFENDVTFIISNFGIALSSTIWGLFLRIFLSTKAVETEEVEQNTRANLNDAARQITATLNSTIIEFTSFANAAQVSRKILEEKMQESAENSMAQFKNALEKILQENEASVQQQLATFEKTATIYNDKFLHSFQDANYTLSQVTQTFTQSVEKFTHVVESSLQNHVNSTDTFSGISERYLQEIEAVIVKFSAIKTPDHVLTELLTPACTKLNHMVSALEEKYLREQELTRLDMATIQECNTATQLFLENITTLSVSIQSAHKVTPPLVDTLSNLITSFETLSSKLQNSSADIAASSKAFQKELLSLSTDTTNKHKQLDMEVQKTLESSQNMHTVLENMANHITTELKK